MMGAYKYPAFWQCMDTFKDEPQLEDLNQSSAPWKVWNHVAVSRSRPSELICATV